MAKMVPATLPAQTESKAERRLFSVLRDGLDDTFTVFHSFNLLTHNIHGKFIEGEIDYLILSPNRGFLVLEVKGGSIVYNGKQDTWYQNNRPMDVNPFKQASASKHKLRDYLASKLMNPPDYTFAHAVCFSDVYTEMKMLPSGADPKICVTGKNLSHIQEKILQIFDSFAGPGTKQVSQSDTEEIIKLIMPYCEYGTSLVDRIGQAERILFSLTENQCRMLEFIYKHHHALIEGCAGSGKTIMAVKKARELASEGKDVLLLAYNRMIGDHLSDSVNDLKNVTATTYHRYCYNRLQKAGKLPHPTGDQEYWERQLPEAFASLIEKSPVQYDAVIVDEGQDFLLEYWVTINELVKPDGYFYIFYDPDQNIYGTNMELPIQKEPFVLTDNCRNTRNIFEKVRQYVEREMRLCRDAPEGEKIVEFKFPNDSDRRRQLGKILHNLINNHSIDRNRIVILGTHSIGNTCIGNNPKVGNFRITEEMENGPNIVHYHTYMKFKGCEADVVILLDVDPKDERWADRMTLYTTISRAKHMLYILYR